MNHKPFDISPIDWKYGFVSKQFLARFHKQSICPLIESNALRSLCPFNGVYKILSLQQECIYVCALVVYVFLISRWFGCCVALHRWYFFSFTSSCELCIWKFAWKSDTTVNRFASNITLVISMIFARCSFTQTYTWIGFLQCDRCSQISAFK